MPKTSNTDVHSLLTDIKKEYEEIGKVIMNLGMLNRPREREGITQHHIQKAEDLKEQGGENVKVLCSLSIDYQDTLEAFKEEILAKI